METLVFSCTHKTSSIGSLDEMEMKPHLVDWPDLLQEALIHIFSKLDFDSLVAAAQVCRPWRAAAQFPESWEAAHLSAHHNFLDQFIKDVGPHDTEKLNSRALHMLAHGEAVTKSICIDSIASDEMLRTITARFPSIESLSLRNCNGISSAAFSELIHACKNLRFIDISFCNVITRKTIEEIGRCCPSLVGLNLTHLQATEEMAIAIGESMPKLKWLNLNSSWVTNNGVCSILQSCNELQYLSVMWCPRLNPEKELMDMAKGIDEFKIDLSIDDYFECDSSYFEKWLLQWYP